MADTLTLHHLEYSQSFRILMLLEEIGLDYELKKYDRDPKTVLAPAAYKAVSPLGTAPVITHGDVVLAESSAIMDYICDLKPDCGLRPEPGSADRARYLFWFHATQGSLMPLMLMDTVLRLSGGRAPFFLRPFIKMIHGALQAGFLGPRMTALIDKAEADLAEKPFFGGDRLSLADILVLYNIEGCAARGLLTGHPNLRQWLQQMHALPSFKTATEKDDRPSMILPM